MNASSSFRVNVLWSQCIWNMGLLTFVIHSCPVRWLVCWFFEDHHSMVVDCCHLFQQFLYQFFHPFLSAKSEVQLSVAFALPYSRFQKNKLNGKTDFTDIITWRRNNGFHFSPKRKMSKKIEQLSWRVNFENKPYRFRNVQVVFSKFHFLASFSIFHHLQQYNQVHFVPTNRMDFYH